MGQRFIFNHFNQRQPDLYKPFEDLFVSFCQIFVLRDEDSILMKAGVIPEEITKNRQEFLRYEMERSLTLTKAEQDLPRGD